LWTAGPYDTGTTIVADLVQGAGDSNPEPLGQAGWNFYFAATASEKGRELWKWDGTTATLVKDINPAGDSNPSDLCYANGLVYFAASTAADGRELWVTDGTGPGTHMVQDLRGGSGSSNPTHLVKAGNQLYFQADGNAGLSFPIGPELWALDLPPAPPEPTGPNLFADWQSVKVTTRGSSETLKCKLKAKLSVLASGTADTTAAARLRCLLSDDPIPDNSDIPVGKIVRIKPMHTGTSRKVKFSGRLPKGQSVSGKYLLGQIDLNNDVQEIDETDNVAVYGPLF
jgi:ELWxxDGT repeat protein